MTTLDDLLALARRLNTAIIIKADLADQLATDILALLDVPQPCGWPEPTVKGPRSLYWEPLGMLLTSDEARAIAAMLLRGADEAEAGR